VNLLLKDSSDRSTKISKIEVSRLLIRICAIRIGLTLGFKPCYISINESIWAYIRWRLTQNPLNMNVKIILIA
jgi:hypothetical protein